jgi:hypothetical protein
MEKISILVVLGISIFIIPTVVGWLYGRNNKTPEQLKQESGPGEWA